MKFTSNPPETPGFYAWRINERDNHVSLRELFYPVSDVLIDKRSDLMPEDVRGEWCRLVPASELTDAWCEGRASVFASNLEETTWQNSRARRVAEGNE